MARTPATPSRRVGDPSRKKKDVYKIDTVPMKTKCVCSRPLRDHDHCAKCGRVFR